MTTRIQAFDFSLNLMEALLWQYNDALNLQGLLQSKQNWYNENYTDFWTNWYTDVFDLRTANDFGLSVWSIILDLPLGVETGIQANKLSWGFGAGANNNRKNFNNGNFSNVSSSFITLTTEQKRIALQLRYFQLTCRGSVPEINRFLAYIFSDQSVTAYVLDSNDMNILYVFSPQLSSQLRFVFQYYDLLPRPSGVGVGIRIIDKNTFGFDQYHANFDNGNFEGE